MMIKTKIFLFILFFSFRSLLGAFDLDTLEDREIEAIQHALESRTTPEDQSVLESLARRPVPLAQRLLAGILLHEENDDNLRVSASWYIISAKNGIQESQDFIESLEQQPFEEFLKTPPQNQLTTLSSHLKSYKDEHRRLSIGEETDTIDLSIPQTASYPAEIIANYIICAEHLKCEPEEPNSDITNLRLQKLLYEAQGLHLAFYGRPITVGGGAFEGWLYGPVERSIYATYAKHKGNAIPKPSKRYFDPESISPITGKFLDFIIDEYGKYSTWYLSKLTHEEGSPWSLATASGENVGGKREKGPIIDPQLLREHFSKQTEKLERLRKFLSDPHTGSCFSHEITNFKAKRSK